MTILPALVATGITEAEPSITTLKKACRDVLKRYLDTTALCHPESLNEIELDSAKIKEIKKDWMSDINEQSSLEEYAEYLGYIVKEGKMYTAEPQYPYLSSYRVDKSGVVNSIPVDHKNEFTESNETSSYTRLNPAFISGRNFIFTFATPAYNIHRDTSKDVAELLGNLLDIDPSLFLFAPSAFISKDKFIRMKEDEIENWHRDFIDLVKNNVDEMEWVQMCIVEFHESFKKSYHFFQQSVIPDEIFDALCFTDASIIKAEGFDEP